MLVTKLMTTAARRCCRSATATRFLSTTSHPIDNNAFLTGVTEEQAKKALERGQQIRDQHHAAKDTFPSVSQGDREIDADEANRKRVIYRSKQRGWLEVDLLLGSWASKNVMSLTAEELQQYEDILNKETIDIFNYISGKDVIPTDIDTPIMKRIQEYCFSSPLGKASIDGFAKNKKYMSN
uniref:Succinate dehydrogenase assembly factor 2, mitochondrial n=1 Tax=Globisporangium ultimum (strain ATCC 200006 / CBS 805.95 / DAOM BR144) TaxID=431595 RepID=K3X3N5_GLOUD